MRAPPGVGGDGFGRLVAATVRQVQTQLARTTQFLQDKMLAIFSSKSRLSQVVTDLFYFLMLLPNLEEAS